MIRIRGLDRNIKFASTAGQGGGDHHHDGDILEEDGVDDEYGYE